MTWLLNILTGFVKPRAEPSMLKILPIIPSQTSQIFDTLF